MRKRVTRGGEPESNLRSVYRSNPAHGNPSIPVYAVSLMYYRSRRVHSDSMCGSVSAFLCIYARACISQHPFIPPPSPLSLSLSLSCCLCLLCLSLSLSLAVFVYSVSKFETVRNAPFNDHGFPAFRVLLPTCLVFLRLWLLALRHCLHACHRFINSKLARLHWSEKITKRKGEYHTEGKAYSIVVWNLELGIPCGACVYPRSKQVRPEGRASKPFHFRKERR